MKRSLLWLSTNWYYAPWICPSDYLLTAVPAWRVDPNNVAPGVAREYGETSMAIRKIGNHADRLFEGLGDSLNGSFCRSRSSTLA
jgi:hypothetical protein